MTAEMLRLRWLWFTIGATMVLCNIVLTLSPSDSPILVFSIWDKLLHFSGFAAIGAWFAMLLPRPRYLLLWVLLVLLGASLEWLQQYVPGRTTDGLDALANALGAGAGVALGFTAWRNTLSTIEYALLDRGTR